MKIVELIIPSVDSGTFTTAPLEIEYKSLSSVKAYSERTLQTIKNGTTYY